MLPADCNSDAAAFRLAVVVKIALWRCMSSASRIECGTLVNESVSHLRVAVSKNHSGIERDADRPLKDIGVFGA